MSHLLARPSLHLGMIEQNFISGKGFLSSAMYMMIAHVDSEIPRII
jgi:hypothetical protein